MASSTVFGSGLLVALCLLASCPGLSAQVFMVGEGVTPNIFSGASVLGSENNRVFNALVDYVTDAKLLDIINGFGFQGIVLVPGNGTVAKAILNHLTTLTPANATKLAEAILKYHVLPYDSSKTGVSFSYPNYKPKDFSSTPRVYPSALIKVDDGRSIPTMETVAIKLFDTKQQLLLASGIAPGAVINLAKKSIGGGARCYLMDDLLLPPNTEISSLYPASLYSTVYINDTRIELAPLRGLEERARESAFWSMQAPGTEGLVFANVTRAVDPQLLVALSFNDTAYTLFVPSNAAMNAYMAKNNLTIATFPLAVLRRHVITKRAYRLASFSTPKNLTVAYSTYAPPTSKVVAPLTYIASTNAKNPLLPTAPAAQVIYQVCPKTKSRAARSRQILPMRSDSISGKSIIHHIDQVFDLCDAPATRRSKHRRSLKSIH